MVPPVVIDLMTRNEKSVTKVENPRGRDLLGAKNE